MPCLSRAEGGAAAAEDRRPRSGELRLSRCSRSPSCPIRSATLWGWRPGPLSQHPAGSRPPGGGGVRIFSEDRRAASPFRCPPGRLVAPSRRQLEAGGPVCKLPAGGRGPPPAGIKARGGAPRRSRCLPGAGRALPPCARPAPALAARRLRVRTRGIGDPRQRRERRARLSRPFGPHGRRPGQRFLRWEPGNRRLRCALP